MQSSPSAVGQKRNVFTTRFGTSQLLLHEAAKTGSAEEASVRRPTPRKIPEYNGEKEMCCAACLVFLLLRGGRHAIDGRTRCDTQRLRSALYIDAAAPIIRAPRSRFVFCTDRAPTRSKDTV